MAGYSVACTNGSNAFIRAHISPASRVNTIGLLAEIFNVADAPFEDNVNFVSHGVEPIKVLKGCFCLASIIYAVISSCDNGLYCPSGWTGSSRSVVDATIKVTGNRIKAISGK